MASHGNLCYSTLQMLVALQEASKLPLVSGDNSYLFQLE